RRRAGPYRSAIDEEFEFGDGAVGVGGGGVEFDLGGSDQRGVIGRAGDGNDGELVANDGGGAEEVHDEPDVGAVANVLVDFDGEDVSAFLEAARRDGDGEGGGAVVGSVGRGEGGIGDRAGGHVEAGEFGAVEVDDCAVVALNVQDDVG